MRYGMMLPYNVRGLDRATILEWYRRIDDGPYESLGCGERITFHNLDQTVTLAAAAAVTNRVRLVADISVLPMHPAALVAKRMATMDVISGGRVTLGVGIGGRPTDYGAAEAPMGRLHQRLDDKVAEIRRLWAGEPALDGSLPIGPPVVQPGGPPLYSSANGPKAVARAAKWADGFLGASMAPERGALEAVAGRWSQECAANGRKPPYLVNTTFWALGDAAEEQMRGYVDDYFEPAGSGMDFRFEFNPAMFSLLSTDGVRRAIDETEAAGYDELMLVPTSADLHQLDQLEAVLSTR